MVGTGTGSLVRGLQGQETVYFKSFADLSHYLDQQGLRLKKEPEPLGEGLEAELQPQNKPFP